MPSAPQHNRPFLNAAELRVGDVPMDLFLTPMAAEIDCDGQAGVIVGTTFGGVPIILRTTSLEWLNALEEAARRAFAKGAVQAGMQAVTP